MRNALIAVATAASLAVAAIAAPTPAEARNGRIAAGVIGGLAAGAIIGGALAGPGYYGGPYYGGGYYGGPYYGGGYYGGPYYGGGYYAAEPVYGPPCTWRGERFWDGWGWQVRRVRVCY